MKGIAVHEHFVSLDKTVQWRCLYPFKEWKYKVQIFHIIDNSVNYSAA